MGIGFPIGSPGGDGWGDVGIGKIIPSFARWGLVWELEVEWPGQVLAS